MYEWTNIYMQLNKSTSEEVYRLDINDLSKMEYYLFEVSANSSANMGWGEPARTMVYTIDTYRRLRPDPPSRPSISKSSIKTTECTISWNTNSDNYSPIRYFTVQVKEIRKKRNSATFLTEYLDDRLRTDNLTAWSSQANENDEYLFNWRTIYVIKTSSSLNNNYRLTVRGKDKLGQYLLKPNGNLYKFRICMI